MCIIAVSLPTAALGMAAAFFDAGVVAGLVRDRVPAVGNIAADGCLASPLGVWIFVAVAAAIAIAAMAFTDVS